MLADGERIVAQESSPTGSPDSTLAALNEILRGWDRDHKLDALGIASFGPLQLDRERSGFATILSTPKPGWSGAPVASRIAQGLDCPWRLETDVNGAALAEYRWGAGRGCESVCYVTIGTGVGGGLLLGGRPVHGAMHPEIGHLRLRRAPGDAFAGLCPFHADCIEGLVSGPALAARFAMPAEEIPDDHPLWETVAADLIELAGALLLTHSAQRILFGGSVSLSRGFLLPLVRTGVVSQLGTYLPFLDPAGPGDPGYPDGRAGQPGRSPRRDRRGHRGDDREAPVDSSLSRFVLAQSIVQFALTAPLLRELERVARL